MINNSLNIINTFSCCGETHGCNEPMISSTNINERHRRNLVALFLFILLTSCAGWDKTDKALLTWNAAAMTADMLQTNYIYDNDNYHEINPVIEGVHNQVGDIGIPLYFGASFLLRYLIADALPSKWRKGFLIGTGSVSTGLVIHNNSIGIGFTW